MEILFWVLDGALAHSDSTGGRGVICPGMVQKMSAGRGVRHAEYNASDAAPVSPPAAARLYAGRLGSGETAWATPADGRRAWAEVARRALSVNGAALGPGDGAALTAGTALGLRAGPQGAEAQALDLA